MLQFIIAYMIGYFMGMFITRHTFLKIIKNVYRSAYTHGLGAAEDLLRKSGHDNSANFLSVHNHFKDKGEFK